MDFKGDGLVSIWHSDPRWGDPKEGTFYMEPPYSEEMCDRACEDRGRLWLRMMVEEQRYPTTRLQFRGPLDYTHQDRHDLSPERGGMDEYVVTAWFKRDKPEVLTVDEIEARREMIQRFGLNPPEPVRYMNDPVPGVSLPMADEFGAYADPHGLNEAGVSNGR